MKRKAFTMIEMLTVVAITAVLLTLIIFPLFQSFNSTKQAQAFVEAQQSAKRLMDRVTSDLSNATTVRDNSGLKGSSSVVVPGADGTPVVVTLQSTKIDIVPPAQGTPSGSGFVNPDTGKVDPTLKTPRGDLNLPIVPGNSIVRYFVGLISPLDFNGAAQPGLYNNPYDNLLSKQTGGRENLYVVWRAQFAPLVYRLRDPSSPAGPTNPQGWYGNTALFDCDPATGAIKDLDDPAFFQLLPTTDYDPATLIYTASGTKKAARIAQWLKTADIASPATRSDALGIVYNPSNHKTRYDGNVPRLFPLVQFRPGRTPTESAEPSQAVRIGEEADYVAATTDPNVSRAAPDTYRTKMAGWVDPILRQYPQGYDPNGASNKYDIIRTDPAVPGFSEFYYDPAAGSDLTTGTELFDITTYENARQNAQTFPFSRALSAANGRSGWLASGSVNTYKAAFIPCDFNSRIGKITSSFGITEWGDVTKTPSAYNPNNLPVADSGPVQTPTADNGAGAILSPKSAAAGSFYLVNHLFNYVYNAHPEVRDSAQRFIDLRVAPSVNSDNSSTYGPLDPTTGFGRFSITPGSEEVYGPDQNPTADPANITRVRYTRTSGTPGPNQYRINYTNQTEPMTAGVVDYSLLGLNPADLATFNPNVYDPTNFVSAVIQPRYKVGYIELNSDPNAPLPQLTAAGVATGQPAFLIYYRFQSTIAGDSIGVDYASRQSMSVQVTVRSYSSGSVISPQTVTLSSQVNVRNYLR